MEIRGEYIIHHFSSTEKKKVQVWVNNDRIIFLIKVILLYFPQQSYSRKKVHVVKQHFVPLKWWRKLYSNSTMLRVLHICAASYSICPWNAWIFVEQCQWHNSHFIRIDDTFSYHHDCWFLPCPSLQDMQNVACNWKQKWSMQFDGIPAFKSSSSVSEFIIHPRTPIFSLVIHTL